MDALIHADERDGQHRVHWITAPTKQLVSQIANAAAQHIPSAMFAPVGQSPEGEERLWKHQATLCNQALPQHVLRLDALAQAATDAIAAAKAAHWSAATELAARNTLRQHFLESFDFLHGDAWQTCLEQHEQNVRLVISTTTYKLKHEARNRLAVKRLLKDKEKGGHVSDEPDMLPYSVTVAAAAEETFLLTANDPAQHMLPIHARNESRSGDDAVAEENVNTWISHAGTTLRLMQTMRHGSAITDLLRETWPNTYPDLSPAPGAPSSTVHTVFCGSVTWWQATSKAGGLVHWKIFTKNLVYMLFFLLYRCHVIVPRKYPTKTYFLTQKNTSLRYFCVLASTHSIFRMRIADVVQAKIDAGVSVLVQCIYAAFRDLLALFLQTVRGIDVTTKQSADGKVSGMVFDQIF